MAAERKNSSGETKIYYCWISSTFDHVNHRNAYVTLTSDQYPAFDYNLSFSNEKFSRIYGDAALFGVKFFGREELLTKTKIKPSDYKTFYPLFTFDVSKEKENSNPR